MDPIRWRVSAKWCARPFDCTVRGIIRSCHGHCCTHHLSSYWPPRVFAPKDCCFLAANGCTLREEDRPLDCLLYPLIFNATGRTIVLHNRALLPNWVCRGCANVGPPLIVALESCLSSMFGAAQYTRVMRSVLAGQDGYFYPSPEVLLHREVEIICSQRNLPPLPRRSITPQTLADLGGPTGGDETWWKRNGEVVKKPSATRSEE